MTPDFFSAVNQYFIYVLILSESEGLKSQMLSVTVLYGKKQEETIDPIVVIVEPDKPKDPPNNGNRGGNQGNDNDRNDKEDEDIIEVIVV